MANDVQKQAIAKAADQIRAAMQLVYQSHQATSDTTTLLKINLEYMQLNTFLNQLSDAQNAADDADFTSATSTLKQQATGLQGQEENIAKVISDVGKAAKVAEYISQALAFIATL